MRATKVNDRMPRLDTKKVLRMFNCFSASVTTDCPDTNYHSFFNGWLCCAAWNSALNASLVLGNSHGPEHCPDSQTLACPTLPTAACNERPARKLEIGCPSACPVENTGADFFLIGVQRSVRIYNNCTNKTASAEGYHCPTTSDP